MNAVRELKALAREVAACEKCERLRAYCAGIAETKRRAYLDQTYWGRPVPPFGDPCARLLVIGLAPAAHGGNRTGRMFTGDRSGDFLFRALWQTGFASQASSTHAGDGLVLTDAYISASVRCAPPDNKPLPDEIRACRSYLERELDLMPDLRVVMALGKIAFDGYLAILRSRGVPIAARDFPFGHRREYVVQPRGPVLIASYHPSQQNTSTGKLTAEMLRQVFERAKAIAGKQ
jgi:uracil-DNA glycosylase